MLDIIQKGLLASLGAAVVTRELIIEATNRLVNEGKLNTEEVQRLADDLMESGRQHWQDVEKEVQEAVYKAVDSIGVARRVDLKELRATVAKSVTQIEELKELQARVANLEQQVHIIFEERSGTASGEGNEVE
jgi:polyhydroxyalkanoate synthesis regulator phasin